MAPILRRLRVLDLSRALAGPGCAQLLGDLGAEVIKLERPGRGDDFRQTVPALANPDGTPSGETALYLAVNRNKKSVTLNLADPEGQAIARQLASHSDVLIENYKPGDLARYGLDYASLGPANPRLVYCSLSGFGQTGPYRARPGFDSIAQALSGFMSTTGLPDDVPGGGPMKTGPSVSDMAAGLYGAVAVIAALYERDANGGRGQHIDIALLDTAVAMMANLWMSYFVSGELPPRLGTETHGGAPNGVYRCVDGAVILSVVADRFAAFCGLLGCAELAADPRFATTRARAANRVALRALLEPRVASRTQSEFLAQLETLGVPAAPIQDIAQAAEDPQIAARGVLVSTPHPLASALRLVANPIRYSETPIESYRAPPFLGQHTDEVLGQLLGMDARQLERLRSKGVV